MKPLEIDGQFWTEDNPNLKVAGRLTYNDTDGVVLDLIGSLHDPMTVLGDQSGPTKSLPLEDLFNLRAEPVRIMGDTPEGSVTLENCLRTDGSIPLTKPLKDHRETYKATVTSVGGEQPVSPHVSFSYCRVTVNHLANWASQSPLSVVEGSESNGDGSTILTVRGPENLQASTAFGSMELFQTVGFSIDGFNSTTLTNSVSIGLWFDPALSRNEILPICVSIQDLVTIGLAAPATIDHIALKPHGADETVSLYGQLASSRRGREQKLPRLGGGLFNLNDLGGIEGLARWVAVAGKYHTAVGHLVSHWYQNPLYAETRLSDQVIAAESMVRIRQQKQHVGLRRALEELAADAGAQFTDLVGNNYKWAKRVADTRVLNVVHRGLSEGDSHPLYLLSESVYYLTVFCLLRECGVEESTFDKIQRSQRYQWLAEQLKGI